MTSIDNVVLQVTRWCENKCSDCFFNSDLYQREALTADTVEQGIDNLSHAGIVPYTAIFTGGEPTGWAHLSKSIDRVREVLPSTRIRVDTNGIALYLQPAKFDSIDADMYQLSIDRFHNEGYSSTLRDRIGPDLYVAQNGRSPMVECFLEHRDTQGFELYVRWTSNGRDDELFDRFQNEYALSNVHIERKNVTATGRGATLPGEIIGEGLTIRDDPGNFSCLMGSSLLLAVDGYWYGCYHPVALTRIGRPGDGHFLENLSTLKASRLYQALPHHGIKEVLEQIRSVNPQDSARIDTILRNKYWYRCQPCVAACEQGVLHTHALPDAMAQEYKTVVQGEHDGKC